MCIIALFLFIFGEITYNPLVGFIILGVHFFFEVPLIVGIIFKCVHLSKVPN